MEFVSPEGLRLDGRRPNDLRRMKAELGVFEGCDGSARVEHGNTKALAVVYGPHEPTRGGALHDRCKITCEYSTATFSTMERKFRSKGDRKSSEVEEMISRTFEEAIMTHLYPRSEVNIFVQILQADGGEMVAVVNAATLALIDAGIAMKDYVVACSAGCIDGTNVLDVNHLEATARGPVLTIAVLPKSAKIALSMMDGRIHMDQFKPLLEVVTTGCDSVYQVLRDSVVKRTEALAANSTLGSA